MEAIFFRNEDGGKDVAFGEVPRDAVVYVIKTIDETIFDILQNGEPEKREAIIDRVLN